MKKITLILLLMLCFSCSKEDQIESSDLSTKLVHFANETEFQAALVEISEIKKEKGFLKWIESKGHEALFLNQDLIKDESIQKLPVVMLAILNKDLEFQIGRKIIFYEDGKFYEYSAENKNKLKKEFHLIGATDVASTRIQLANEPKISDQKYVSMNNNEDVYKVWKGYNRIYYREYCNPRFLRDLEYRLVHELKTKSMDLGYASWQELSITFRMSFNTSHWHSNTTTQRLLDVDLSGTASALNYSKSFTLNESFTCSNPAIGSKTYVLAGFNYPASYGNFTWNVSVNGTIIHQVNGDDSHIWQHYVNW